ncbi:MAG: N-acetylmuramoyl-L-alanine amidase [Cyclobacteriaceae bacterium]
MANLTVIGIRVAFFLLFYLLWAVQINISFAQGGKGQSVLAGTTICIDPGHGGTAETDSYRVGTGGEREEWINLRVALILQEMLEQAGSKVIMTRTSDEFVPLEKRSELARAHQADLFLSIHHNATADDKVNFPIIYFHGSANENRASVSLGKLVAKQLVQDLFQGKGPFSLVSDFTIFPQSGASVLKGTYGIPGIIAEASFFSHPREEKRLKRNRHNKNEADAFFEAIVAFFTHSGNLLIGEKVEPDQIPAFEVFQEADRMRPEALLWKTNYVKAKKLWASNDPLAWEEAMRLLTLSVRSFPDSYLARKCHLLRINILLEQGNKNEAEKEAKRISSFYPD